MQADTPAAIMLPLVARFLASVVSAELDEFVIRAKPHEFVIPTEAKRSEGICIFYPATEMGAPSLPRKGGFHKGITSSGSLRHPGQHDLSS
jgi:hypothetical protein